MRRERGPPSSRSPSAPTRLAEFMTSVGVGEGGEGGGEGGSRAGGGGISHARRSASEGGMSVRAAPNSPEVEL